MPYGSYNDSFGFNHSLNGDRHWYPEYTREPEPTSASEALAIAITLPAILAAFTLGSLGLLYSTFAISGPLCALVGAGLALQILIPLAVGALLTFVAMATVVAIGFAICALCSYLSNRSKAKDSASTDQTQKVAAAVAPSQAIPEHVAQKSDLAADARKDVLKAELNARRLIAGEQKSGFDEILQEYIPFLRKQYPEYPRGYGFGVGNCGRQGLGTHGGIGHTMDKEDKPLYGFRVYATDSVQVSRARALLN